MVKITATGRYVCAQFLIHGANGAPFFLFLFGSYYCMTLFVLFFSFSFFFLFVGSYYRMTLVVQSVYSATLFIKL